MFAIVLAALDRSGSVLPILCAMAVHELAHIVMMLACGGQVRRLTLRFADLQIAASGLGYRQELLSGAGGTAGQFDLRRSILYAAAFLRRIQSDAGDL
ncbi:MAG: hypothetical protein ACLS3C_08495 [Oscillospiraceae bacterium]